METPVEEASAQEDKSAVSEYPNVLNCCTSHVWHPSLQCSCVSCCLMQGLPFPCFSCHSTSSRWPVTWYVLILVETQKFKKKGERAGKSHSKFHQGAFFCDTGKLLMLEDEALGLGELELLPDSTSLPLLGRKLLCFQLGVLWRFVKKSRAQCVFGLVVHVVLCCTIWLSHWVAPGSNLRDPDPWNKWPLVHKSLLTALFYKQDVWFALSVIWKRNSEQIFFCPPSVDASSVEHCY